MHKNAWALPVILMIGLAVACGQQATTPAGVKATPEAQAIARSDSSPAAPETPTQPAAEPHDTHATSTAPPAPAYREVTLPAGTALSLRLEHRLASDSSRVEDPVRARLRRAIIIDGVDALPTDSLVVGSVTEVAPAGKVKGRARLAFRFHQVVTDEAGRAYEIRTPTIVRQAQGTKKKDAAKIGIPAAGGAIIGAIVGGTKGAAIGAVAGGGGGAAVVMSTRGEEVRLGPDARLQVKLLEPLTVRVRIR